MAVAKKSAVAKKKVVNTSRIVKKVIKPPKKKGGARRVSYLITVVCPPARCPVCHFYPVFADAFGSYKCPPKCYNEWKCTTCGTTNN